MWRGLYFLKRPLLNFQRAAFRPFSRNGAWMDHLVRVVYPDASDPRQPLVDQRTLSRQDLLDPSSVTLGHVLPPRQLVEVDLREMTARRAM